MVHLPTQAGRQCQHCGAEITAPGGIIIVKKRATHSCSGVSRFNVVLQNRLKTLDSL